MRVIVNASHKEDNPARDLTSFRVHVMTLQQRAPSGWKGQM